jgi:hypothetical protein
MKKIIQILILFIAISVFSQSTGVNDKILLGAYIPKQAENIPHIAKKMLYNKLTQAITKNGISDDINNSRFIITPKVFVLSKNITATAPTMHAVNLEVTLYLGDGISGNLFSSETFTLKGVGTNENKAFISAFKRLNPNNKILKEFLLSGKEKIIDYYNNNCNLIINKVDNLEMQNRMIDALVILSSIPEASSCFESVKPRIHNLYLKAINEDCKNKLNIANSIWVANQDINSANKAGAILSTVNPNSACFTEVNVLYNKIASRVKEVSDRPWKYSLKMIDVKLTEIEAARQVGIAYGNNQPKSVSYNIHGWY